MKEGEASFQSVAASLQAAELVLEVLRVADVPDQMMSRYLHAINYMETLRFKARRAVVSHPDFAIFVAKQEEGRDVEAKADE